MMSLIPVLRAEPDVQMKPAPAGFRILAALDGATKVMGQDLWLTCGCEGHPPTDPHTLGEAFDLSVQGLSPARVVKLRDLLLQTLGMRFTVLYEVPHTPNDVTLAGIAYVNPDATGPHIHIQRAKGTTYPPITEG